MKKILPLLMLIGVILTSGCVGQDGGTTTTATNGLIIKDFSFSPTNILPGETTELALDVQNVGGEIATLKKITVFGVDSKQGDASPLQWGLPSGEDFIVNTFNPADLIPPESSTGFEGDFYPQSWHPQAPTGVKAQTNYDFEVRVQYGYTTTYTGFIRLMEDSYLNTLSREERESLQQIGGVVNPSVTGGPLTLAAASGRHFVIRTNDVGGDRTIKFKVTNVGSGSPYGDSISTDLYKISAQGSGVTCNPSIITLSRGKTGILSCTFNTPDWNSPDIQGKNKIDKAFSLTLTYNYFIDSSASITVNPGY